MRGTEHDGSSSSSSSPSFSSSFTNNSSSSSSSFSSPSFSSSSTNNTSSSSSSSSPSFSSSSTNNSSSSPSFSSSSTNNFSGSSIFSTSISMAIRSSRSILSNRRNQVVSMDNSHEKDIHEFDLFQTHIADRLLFLQQNPQKITMASSEKKKRIGTGATQDQLFLTIAFLHNLLDAYLYFDDEFGPLLARNPTAINKPTVEKVVSDHLDRSIKALDFCTAVAQSLDSLLHAQKHAIIATDAIRGVTGSYSPNEAQFNRAKNAIAKLLSAISEKPPPAEAERAWLFGRNSRGSGSVSGGESSTTKYQQRLMSLTLSKNWSAAKQLQSMSATLHPPRGGDGSTLALAIYTMSTIQFFTMWVLVAAFPSQDRCPAPSFPSPSRQLPWTSIVVGMQEKVVEEWKKKEKKGAGSMLPSGMLTELQGLEKCGRNLIELGEGLRFPVEGDRAREIVAEVKKIEEIITVVNEDARALQRKVREVFHRIARSRADIVDLVLQGSRASSTNA